MFKQYDAMKKTIGVTLFLILIVQQLFAQPGSLDATFGSNGVTLTAINFTNSSIATCLAIQSDGKILVGAFFDDWGPINTSGGLLRYTSQGKLDSSFANGGINENGDVTFSVASQPDGQYAWLGLDYLTIFLLKTDANGSGDTLIELDDEEYRQIKYQTDNKLVVSGGVYDSGQIHFGMIRLNADGSSDLTFGTAGKINTKIGSGYSLVNSSLIQPDGKIILGGESKCGTSVCFTLARYDINGMPDATFGNGGIVQTDIGPDDDYLSALALQSDGKIVAAGSSQHIFYRDPALVRYNMYGQLDTTFGINGMVTDFNSESGGIGSIAIQNDGKIIASGVIDESTMLCRFDSTGSLDSSFGVNGMVINSTGPLSESINQVSIQPDGKIVIVGGYAPPDYSIFIARYLSGLNVGIIDFSIASLPVLIYPNPVRTEAILKYTLNSRQHITIGLYDMPGCMVQSFIVNEQREQGEQEELLKLDTSLPPGNYILSISNGNNSQGVQVTKMN